MPQTKVTVSSNLPDAQSADRITREAIREAAKAGATHHHDHNLKNHFEDFSGAKYGYSRRAQSYLAFKEKCVRLGLIPRENATKYLVLSGKTRDEILTSRQIRATATRGATLIVSASLEGLSSGRFLTVAAVERMIAAATTPQEKARLAKKLRRLLAANGAYTMKQSRMIERLKEIQAISKSEISGIAAVEEKTFDKVLKEALRRQATKRINNSFGGT